MLTQVHQFAARVEQCRQQTFQPGCGQVYDHPILPRRARVCSSRGYRHFESASSEVKKLDTPKGKCLFCNGKHPSLLCLVTPELETVIPSETDSIFAAESWLAGKDLTQIQTYYGLTEALASHNGINVPHLTRTFCNLTPASVAAEEACFVTAVHPAYHINDFVDVPNPVIEAMIRTWQLIESWAIDRNLTIVPFINGGRRPESAQSVACPHGQAYVVKEIPALFDAIRRRRESASHCPTCRLHKDTRLQLWEHPSGDVKLIADPAPQHSWSLLAIPSLHAPNLQAINPQALAEAIQRGVRAWRGLFGLEPAFNVLIRCGSAVGHVFAEIVPRSETNIHGGYEGTTQEFVIDVSPEFVRRELSHRVL